MVSQNLWILQGDLPGSFSAGEKIILFLFGESCLFQLDELVSHFAHPAWLHFNQNIGKAHALPLLVAYVYRMPGVAGEL